MNPRPFEYAAPSSIEEAIALSREREGAKFLAGGQSLIPLMKLRLASPEVIIDLNRIRGLEYIKESEGWLRIGALTRMADIGSSNLIRGRYPIISEAAAQIADPLVRNVGTIGGNLAHGDPGNDMPAVMVALDSEFLIRGPGGERAVRAREFYRDTFVTALEKDEILTEVRVREHVVGSGGSYMKLERRVGDFAIVGVAAQLRLDSDRVSDAGIGLSAVGPTVLVADAAMKRLRGGKVTEDLLEEASELASQASEPSSDLRGSAEYKRAMVKVLAKRSLLGAYERARSSS